MGRRSLLSLEYRELLANYRLPCFLFAPLTIWQNDALSPQNLIIYLSKDSKREIDILLSSFFQASASALPASRVASARSLASAAGSGSGARTGAPARPPTPTGATRSRGDACARRDTGVRTIIARISYYSEHVYFCFGI